MRIARFYLLASIITIAYPIFIGSPTNGQQTNNSSSLTNSAAPAASSSTVGGTNINYQTNNTYQNEFGFGPGIFCRTPTIFIGGNYGQNTLSAYDIVSTSGNNTNHYAINAGLVVPIASPVIESCRRVSASIVEDRLISTQLSLIRACAQLQKEGIRVDPELYPMLEKCTVSVIAQPSSASLARPSAVKEVGTSPMQVIPPRKIPQMTRS